MLNMRYENLRRKTDKKPTAAKKRILMLLINIAQNKRTTRDP